MMTLTQTLIHSSGPDIAMKPKLSKPQSRLSPPCTLLPLAVPELPEPSPRAILQTHLFRDFCRIFWFHLQQSNLELHAPNNSSFFRTIALSILNLATWGSFKFVRSTDSRSSGRSSIDIAREWPCVPAVFWRGKRIVVFWNKLMYKDNMDKALEMALARAEKDGVDEFEAVLFSIRHVALVKVKEKEIWVTECISVLENGKPNVEGFGVLQKIMSPEVIVPDGFDRGRAPLEIWREICDFLEPKAYVRMGRASKCFTGISQFQPQLSKDGVRLLGFRDVEKSSRKMMVRFHSKEKGEMWRCDVMLKEPKFIRRDNEFIYRVYFQGKSRGFTGLVYDFSPN
ncbi:Protein of unknown function [Pyronema omphalodes CBS 100304]|uniref:F-box domain-containing protein n=1 Tax=Pyronema omphalodes (strain CBS 100304) TaxID=1076935 RepID=U4LFC4_PYROM|nr:Protein of unknown function [Pyronema omphalodes CBS 100304]